jgi:DNA-binding CsgD family transcriptional regulator
VSRVVDITAPPPLLHGREPELERIEAVLASARQARSAVLAITGQAGIGKTALLDVARERAADMLVLACRGTQSEARLPFAALHQLLRPALGHLDAVPAVQAGALRSALGLEAAGGRPERLLVSLGVLSLLAEAARDRPLLCLVDDVQWIDDASVDALAFAARRLDHEPIAMLFASRDDDDVRVEAQHLPQLPLAGLDDDAARALLAGLGDDVAQRLLALAAGNPLALLELSGALTDDQRSGVEPFVGPPGLSAHLERTFLERARRLPRPAQRLLLVAATDESGETTTILDAAAHLGLGTEALDDAERAGLVRTCSRHLEFRHPLVRSAIYHAAPLSDRLAAHAALAAILVGDARADRRAWHRAAATVQPDPSVVADLEQAAERARARGGHDAASLALERAAALAGDEAETARLLVAAAESAWLRGRAPRALALLRRVQALPAAAAVRADAGRLRGMIEISSGVPAESSALLVAVAQDVAGCDPERALYLLSLAGWGAACARDADAIVAIADAAQRLAVPERPANRFLRLRLAGLRAHFTGDFDRAAEHFRATLALADEPSVATGLPEQLGLLSPVGVFLCDDSAVLALHRRAAARAREDGMVSVLAQALPWVALGDLWGGQPASACAALAEGLELARLTGQRQTAAHLIAIRALLAAVRGDEPSCRALAADALAQAADRRLLHVTCCATWALEVLELGLGRPEAALAHARALPAAAGIDWDALDRIEAAARAGAPDLARAWLERFEPWARSSRAPWGEAVALHCRALLAADDAEAEALFGQALALHERAQRPFERARTELALGERLRRAHRRADARTHLRAALDRFEAIGAEAWAGRARAELRASGERARRRDPSTLDQLTAQEVQIVQLVAEGRTNRDVAGQLFLSPRTIDFHLRNVFRKLGITSRTELARMDVAQAPAGGEG